MKRVSPLLGLLLALSASLAQALPEDRQQAIRISADQAELDERQGVAIYRGNVVLSQGTLRLNADQIRVQTDKDGVRHLVATGQPAHYQEQPVKDQPLTHGYALRIEYDVANQRVLFLQQARLERAADRFSGERIEIDTANDVVAASGGEGANSKRVEMVIQPRTNTP